MGEKKIKYIFFFPRAINVKRTHNQTTLRDKTIWLVGSRRRHSVRPCRFLEVTLTEPYRRGRKRLRSRRRLAPRDLCA